MDQETKNELRKAMPMKAYTLYIDDVTKLEVIKKLKKIGMDTAKGSLAATIRVMLSLFANDKLGIPDDEMALLITDEYLFTTKKNKRSSL